MSQAYNLLDHGINKSATGKCSCGGNSFSYQLPIKLEADILPFVEKFGVPAFDFLKTHLLRIENSRFAINGVRRLKEIKFVIKQQGTEAELNLFEESLIEYVNSSGRNNEKRIR